MTILEDRFSCEINLELDIDDGDSNNLISSIGRSNSKSTGLYFDLNLVLTFMSDPESFMGWCGVGGAVNHDVKTMLCMY